jgi:hypothetical protein
MRRNKSVGRALGLRDTSGARANAGNAASDAAVVVRNCLLEIECRMMRI